jgi:hypothetical protein
MGLIALRNLRCTCWCFVVAECLEKGGKKNEKHCIARYASLPEPKWQTVLKNAWRRVALSMLRGADAIS